MKNGAGIKNNLDNISMELTQEEKDILAGKHGKCMQKILKIIVKNGDLFGAKRLVPLDAPIHVVTSMGMSGLDAVFNMYDEFIKAGIKTKQAFTVDPRPVDYENVECTDDQKYVFEKLYGNQERYEEQLKRLGLKNEKSFTCTPYMSEVGSIPQKGQMIAWTESSAIVYANSVLGARTNRNSAIIELLCGIAGKAPEFGFLTDEGRRAQWVVEVKTLEIPNPYLLGTAIGKKVIEDVPYIKGLDKFLGTKLDDTVKDYLKDMGAGTASNGAVGLYHVENLTPEAADLGRDLLIEGYQTYYIDEAELDRVMKSLPMMWKNENANPEICLIGCPHLSLNQIFYWQRKICTALKKARKKKIAIRVILCAAADVLAKFKEDKKAHLELTDCGVKLTSLCPTMYMTNPETAKHPAITNSTKLGVFTTSRFFMEDQILDAIVHGLI
jgi:predicted aconitase